MDPTKENALREQGGNNNENTPTPKSYTKKRAKAIIIYLQSKKK